MKRLVPAKVFIVLGTFTALASVAVGVALRFSHFRSHETELDEVEYFLDRSHQEVPLKRAEVFESRRIGYAGEPSRLASLFAAGLAGRDAEQQFVDLVQFGAAGARLYGLCGLHLLGSDALASKMSIARRDQRRVAVLSGCSFSTMSVEDAVDSERFWSICRGIPGGD